MKWSADSPNKMCFCEKMRMYMMDNMKPQPAIVSQGYICDYRNLTATFARMRAEREREAADEIARGNEAAKRVTALADRTVVETVSEAQKNADIVRGEADAERNAIFAEAFGRDPEFFAFYRSLTAYEKSLQGSNSTMVISPDSEFFDYLKSDMKAKEQ